MRPTWENEKRILEILQRMNTRKGQAEQKDQGNGEFAKVDFIVCAGSNCAETDNREVLNERKMESNLTVSEELHGQKHTLRFIFNKLVGLEQYVNPLVFNLRLLLLNDLNIVTLVYNLSFVLSFQLFVNRFVFHKNWSLSDSRVFVMNFPLISQLKSYSTWISNHFCSEKILYNYNLPSFKITDC